MPTTGAITLPRCSALGLLAGLALACTSDRLVRPGGPLPAVPALDQLAVRFVKFDLGASTPQAIVTLSNTGEATLGTVSLDAITYVTGRSDWLAVQVTSGADSNSAMIVLTPTYAAGVQPSADSVQVRLSASGSDSTRTITVTGQVLPGAKIGFSATRLTFAADTGSTTAQPGVLQVLNVGNGPLAFPSLVPAIVPAKSWLMIAPSTPAGFFLVTANPTGQPTGSDSTYLRFTSPISRLPDSVIVVLSIGNPVINPSNGSPNFISVAGATVIQPASGFIDVTFTNSGSGSLGSLSLEPPSYPVGEPAGWLGTSLVGNVVRLTATPGALTPATYTATLTIRASGGAGVRRDLPIQLTVNPAAPKFVLGARVIEYEYDKVDCTGIPATWNCRSGGGSAVEVRFFDLGGLSWQRAPTIYGPGEPTDWVQILDRTLLPDVIPNVITVFSSDFFGQGANIDAFPNGVYSAKIPINVVDGQSDTIRVRLTVRNGSPPTCQTCGIGTQPRISFGPRFNCQRPPSGSCPEGGLNYRVYTSFGIASGPDTVVVQNGGSTGSLGTITRGAVQYTPGQPANWLNVSALSGSTAPATMVISLNPAVVLPEGIYQATIPVSSTVTPSRSLLVTASILPPPRYSLVPHSLSLSTGTGTTSQQTAVFLENNVGGGRPESGSVAAPIYTPGQPGGWLQIQICCEFTVALLAGNASGLQPGTYTAKLPATLHPDPPTTSPFASDTVSVTFTVSPPPRPAVLRLGVQTVTLSGLAGDTTHIAYSVPAFNGGSGGSLGTLSTDPPAYNPTDSPSWLTVTTNGTNLLLDARPTGLPPDSTFEARVGVHASGADSAAQLTVQFRLNQPVQAFATPLISFSTDTLRMTYSLSGGSGAIADTVGVEDARRSTIPLLGLQVGQPSYAGATGWIVGAFLTSTTGPTTLAVAIQGNGLAEGDYVATLPVSATTANVEIQTLPVLLTVTP